ncbi:MAG: tRNA (N6-threonylcarbamoyladenosine(37)-N6)-methyltransferase TrmO [Candidatus Hodarchaeota archaeon]
MSIILRPIGIIRSPFQEQAGTPIQSVYSQAEGTIQILEEFKASLKDIELFCHIILLYWFHRSVSWKPLIIPYRDTQERGIFAVRAPARPNPIGISTVDLVERHSGILRFKGIDVLDGTPLIGLKPFAPEFDNRPHATSGWLAQSVERKKAHKRFAKTSNP